MLQNITSGDGLGNLIEGLQKKYGVFTRMDFGETQKGLIILENDKYKIEIFNGVHKKLKTVWKETGLILNEKMEAEKIENYEKDYIYFLKNR